MPVIVLVAARLRQHKSMVDHCSRIHTNQKRNINKGSNDQSGASTPNYDKASNTMEKQRHANPGL